MSFSAAKAGHYEIIPYTSKPFPQSHPVRLAALAALFGLHAPQVEIASVLELGCAAGGNIIPSAVRFPKAKFLGVDITERHVKEGIERVRQLNLDNIVINQADIGALDLGSQKFDFIICHGVYSWVPAHVREAILRLTSNHLTSHGLAYISYNVFPGWHMRGVIRDMMLYHAGFDGDPQFRVQKARWVLANIADLVPGDSPYSQTLRNEARSLQGFDDGYILGEFLEIENVPCYFRDFVAAAQKYGLDYLCETEIHQCLPENMGSKVASLVRTMSAENLIPLEQYMDFLKGRTFRQTILAKSAVAAKAQRILTSDRVRSLHVRASGSIELKDLTRFTFRTSNGGTLDASRGPVEVAIRSLIDAYPSTCSVADLLAAAGTSSSVPLGDVEVLDAVFKLIISGLAEASSVPISAGRVTQRPTATPLAKLDASRKANWTTNLFHEVVPLDVVMQALLPRLDGSTTHEQLEQELELAVASQQLTFTDNQTGTVLMDHRLNEAIREHVRLALEKLSRAGLLAAV
jgi:methyltransferase-like protein/trans-aconitate methyltransferase